MANEPELPRLAYSPEQAAVAAGVGRTLIFEAIRNRKLCARKAGRRTLISASDLQEWINSLPKAGKSAAA